MALSFEPVAGKKYRITFKAEYQRLARTAVLQYFGRADDYTTSWNARPIAGTQRLYDSEIISIVEVPDKTDIHLGEIVRP